MGPKPLPADGPCGGEKSGGGAVVDLGVAESRLLYPEQRVVGSRKLAQYADLGYR